MDESGLSTVGIVPADLDGTATIRCHPGKAARVPRQRHMRLPETFFSQKRPLMLYFANDSLDPAWNQAFEEYVFDHVTEDDVLLVWRNSPAVVCGRFQNAFAEVSVPETARRGIPVIRRPSGGGTVYHDQGNVNYTIIRDGSPFDRDYASFIEPVAETLRALGIPARFSGDSDIAVDGLKVSGSAQRAAHGRVLHHATLLYKSDLCALRTLTRGRRAWFTTKGTDSKPAPVTNMCDHMDRPFATADAFLRAFTDALTKRLGTQAGTLPDEAGEEIARLARSTPPGTGRSAEALPSRTGARLPGAETGQAAASRPKSAWNTQPGRASFRASPLRRPVRHSKRGSRGRNLIWTQSPVCCHNTGLKTIFFPCSFNLHKEVFMSDTITMPSLRPEMKSGILAAWLKEPGEAFKKGEPVFEIETDKVVSQIEASRDGVMGRHLVDEGDEVACGTAIAEIE